MDESTTAANMSYFNINESIIEILHNKSQQILVEEPESILFEECFNSTSPEIFSSRYVQLFLILLYSSTALIALMGNIIVIIVQIIGNETPPQNLRKYLINLAVSDIVISVFCVPFTYTDFMLGQWVFPGWLCPATQYVQLLSVFITSNTLTIIGIERYTATMHPFSDFHRWLRSNSYTLVSLTWLIGCFYAYIPIEHTYAEQFLMPDNRTVYYECNYDNGLSRSKRRNFMAANFILTFIIPCTVIVFSYSAIMRKIIHGTHAYSPPKDSSNNNSDCSNNTTNSRSPIQSTKCTKSNGAMELKSLKRVPVQNGAKIINCNNNFTLRTFNVNKTRTKTIKIMLIVIILYGICWMPIKMYQFLLEYDIIWFCTEWQYYAQIYGYMACHWLAMANSFVNPIIYSFMSQRFRNDFRRIMTFKILRLTR